jgi:hypothetical protein
VLDFTRCAMLPLRSDVGRAATSGLFDEASGELGRD